MKRKVKEKVLPGGGIRKGNVTWTRRMRTGELNRAALIYGLITEYTKGECLRMHAERLKRVKAGEVIYESRGVWRGTFLNKGQPENWD
jgi:hypothetical protein